jgi:hypothetical protein
MAQPLIERPTAPNSSSSSPDGTVTASSPTPTTQESLRAAMSYLDTAGRRLKKGEAEQADEVLRLLQEAAAHLQLAISPQRHLSGAE